MAPLAPAIPTVVEEPTVSVLSFEGEGPARRAQAELAAALAMRGDEEHWSMGATLRLVLITGGLLWATIVCGLFLR